MNYDDDEYGPDDLNDGSWGDPMFPDEDADELLPDESRRRAGREPGAEDDEDDLLGDPDAWDYEDFGRRRPAPRPAPAAKHGGLIRVLAAAAAVMALLLLGRGLLERKPAAGFRPSVAPIISQTPVPTAQATPAPTRQPTPSPKTSAAQLAAAMPAGLRYYNRSQLSSQDAGLYDQLADGISRMEAEFRVDSPDWDHVFALMNLVLADHPEYFWTVGDAEAEIFDGYQMFKPGYTMTRQRAESLQPQIDAVADPVIRQLQNRSEYEKVKGVYEFLVDYSVYDTGAPDQSLCQVMLEKHGVCMGYAKSTQYLLQKLGVETVLITGTGHGGGHAWNVVRVDGDYYHVDTTWGDPTMDSGEQTLVYDYLCLTTQEILLDHTLDAGILCPDCTATACNYYRREGRFFTGGDTAGAAALVLGDLQSGRASEIRAADAATFRQLKAGLVDGEDLAANLQNGRFYYDTNDLLFILRFWT